MTLEEAAKQADQLAEMAERVEGGNDVSPALFRVFAAACRELGNDYKGRQGPMADRDAILLRKATRDALSRAFTLPELLIVVLIVGILMGVLLPALSAARESARDVKCKANLHSLGVATFHHAEMYRLIPDPPSGVLTAADTPTWDIDAGEVWQCPSDRDRRPVWYYYHAKSVTAAYGLRLSTKFHYDNMLPGEPPPLPVLGDFARVHWPKSANTVNLYGVAALSKEYSDP